MKIKNLVFPLFLFPSFYLSAQSVTITYLANEGVMISERDMKILIDPLFTQDYGTYLLLPEKEQDKIRLAQSPYNDVDLILISHVHGDHFDSGLVNQHLIHNPACTLVGSKQVTDNLKGASNYQPILADRIITFSPKMHQDYQKYDHENVVIRGQWIRHGNQRNWDIINLVFLLEYNGVKILHGGDAEGLPEFFAPFNFQEANIDVALLPFWYLLDGDGKNLVEKYISPDKVIGIHVPRVFNTYMEKIKTHFPDDVIFTKTGQVLEIEINK